MIDYVPITRYELRFPKKKELPLYIYYTLLGQEYETLRNDPMLLEECGEDVDYVLDVLHTALNGFPEHKSVYCDSDTRVFNVRFGAEDGGTRLARVCFYIDNENDVLCCNIQRGNYGADCSDTCTHIEYEPGYVMEWQFDDLDFYGLLNYDKEALDD